MNPLDPLSIRRAFLSFYEKEEPLLRLAQELVQRRVKIIATEGTAKALDKAGVQATSVEEYTGMRPRLGGRLKSIHPKIFAGTLARRDVEDDLRDLRELQAHSIDLVAIFPYPIRSLGESSWKTREDIVEHIDIGGPLHIAAAAKNFEFTAVVCDDIGLSAFLTALREKGTISFETRTQLAHRAFGFVGKYFGEEVRQTLAPFIAGAIWGTPL